MVLYTLSFGTPRSSFRVHESSIIPLNFNLNLIIVHVYYWIRNCRKKVLNCVATKESFLHYLRVAYPFRTSFLWPGSICVCLCMSLFFDF